MLQTLRKRFPPGAAGILLLYILLHPLVDVLAGLGAAQGHALTVGTVVRTAALIAAALYVLLCRPFPGKKRVLWVFWLITGYLGLFALQSLLSGGVQVLAGNMIQSMKLFYFPYMLMLLWVLYRQECFLVPQWAVASACAGYCAVIFIAWLTGTSHASYNSGHGFCGWFYAANAVSILILLTAPTLVCCTLKRLERPGFSWEKVGLWASLGCLAFSATFLGTKLIYLGLLAFLGCSGLWFLVNTLRTRKKESLRCLVAVLLLLALLLCLYPVSPLNDYLDEVYTPMNGEDQAAYEASLEIPGLVEKDREEAHRRWREAAQGTWLGELVFHDPVVEKLNWLLSSRLIFLAPVLQEYIDGGPWVWLFGLGYEQLPQYERDVTHAIEMEAPSMLLRHGILGFCLYYGPFLVLCAWLVLRFLRRLGRCFGDYSCLCRMFSLAAALATSTFVGHTTQAPTVSMFVALLCIRLACGPEPAPLSKKGIA